MRIRRLATLAMATLLAMAGCGSDDGRLARLRKEKLASVTVPGTGPSDTVEQQGGRGLIKETHAMLSRRMPILPGADADTVLGDALQIAKDDDWIVKTGPTP